MGLFQLILLTFTFYLLVFIHASPKSNYRYLFDKDTYYTSNTLYDKLCSKHVTNTLICIVLKIDPFNYFISEEKSYFINLSELRLSDCFYMDYHYRSIMADLTPHLYVVYPYSNDTFTFFDDLKFSNDQTQFSDHISLIQMTDDHENFESCIIIVSELCRSNVDFSSNLSLLIKGPKLNILSISAANAPVQSHINYGIKQSMGFQFPSAKEFNAHINAVIIDQGGNLTTIQASVEKFFTAYAQYEIDLYSGLKFIIDHVVYGEILRLSSLYFNSYSSQLANHPKTLTRVESSQLLSDTNEFVKKLSILLDRQNQPPSKYGPVCANAFFKKTETAYAAI